MAALLLRGELPLKTGRHGTGMGGRHGAGLPGRHQTGLGGRHETGIGGRLGPDFAGWGFRPLENRWIRAIEEDSVWVAELEGTIRGVGYIRFFEELGEVRAHLHALYLTPELLNQGIGYELAKLMLQTAREQSASVVTLQSSLTAHDFYKRLGFVDTSDMVKIVINGHPVSCYPMALKLSER